MKNFALAFTAVISCSAMAASEQSNEIAIPQSVAYYDVNIIQDNVVKECQTLGADLSTYLAQDLEANGFQVKRVAPEAMTTGLSLDVKITNLISAGNAFTGHKKNVSVVAKIQNNGQALETHSFTRSSMGGFAAGFKSSCSVLDRTVEALGRDIANWYKGLSPSVAARTKEAVPQTEAANPAPALH